jgi:hypothetical protein
VKHLHLGPSLYFLLDGVLVGVVMLCGLSQREFREFGALAGEPSQQGDTTARSDKGT